MKKLALHVAAISLLLAGSAAAADLRRPAPVKAPAPVPVAAYNWTGCYVGAGGGYGMWRPGVAVIRQRRLAIRHRGAMTTAAAAGSAPCRSAATISSARTSSSAPLATTISAASRATCRCQRHLWTSARRSSSPHGRPAAGSAGFRSSSSWSLSSGGYTEARFDQVDFCSSDLRRSGDRASRSTRTPAGSSAPDMNTASDGCRACSGRPNIASPITARTNSFSNSDAHDRWTRFDLHKRVHTVRSELVWRFNFGGPVVARY